MGVGDVVIVATLTRAWIEWEVVVMGIGYEQKCNEMFQRVGRLVKECMSSKSS